MNETSHEENETTNGDLIDLAAGQQTFAEGVRLRLALLLDRKKAAEYARLRQLRREMRSLGTVSDVPPAPLWLDAPPARPTSTQTVTWGKFTMKRRNVLAAYAVLLLTMTGISVARKLAPSQPPATAPRPIVKRYDLQDVGRNGSVTVNVTAATPAPGAAGGRQEAQTSRRIAHILFATIPLPSENGEPSKPLTPEEQKSKDEDAKARASAILADIRAGKITFAEAAKKYSDDKANAAKGGDIGVFSPGQLDPDFEKAAFGIMDVGNVIGPVKSAFGYHLITLLAPPGANDAPYATAQRRDLTARYAATPRFPIDDRDGGKNGTGNVIARPGLLNAFSLSNGLSWKLVGYAKVQARFPGETKSDEWEALFIDFDRAKKSSSPAGRENLRLLEKFAPPPGVQPTLYWTLAEKPRNAGLYPVENGWWKTVRQTGTFRGYGEHEVRDESGKLLLTFVITPLNGD